jgi:hypothetical protein
MEMVEIVGNLIEELATWSPKHSILDSIGIVYRHYWFQENANNVFPQHLEVLK